MTAKSLLNHLQLLDKRYGLEEVPIFIFHNSEPSAFKFMGISIDMHDNGAVKQIQINVTKDNKYKS